MTPRRPTIIILIAEGFHEIEAFVPYYRFLEIGWTVHMLSPQNYERIVGKFGMPLLGFTSLNHFRVEEADVLFIPGGRAPRYMVTRHQMEIQRLGEHFLDTGKPIGAIGYGPLVLAHIKHPAVIHIDMTADDAIRAEIAPRVGIVRDEAYVISGNIVTSRGEKDFPSFMKAMFHVLFERDNTFFSEVSEKPLP